MDSADLGRPAVVRVERADPLVVSCSACGWVPKPWQPDDPRPLLHGVVDHWVEVHWKRPGRNEGGR
ncbi:MAG: hypothetical protein ACRDYA_15255 [Egibacteraceae bacterium]